MRLSLGQAWDETRALFARDGGAIIAVALALLVLPGTIAELVTPNVAPGETAPSGWWDLVTILALILSLVGQIAIVRIALGRQGTVAEAIGHGVRRSPTLVGALLLYVLPFALLIGGLVAAVGGSSPAELAGKGALVLPMILLLLLFIFISFRLLLVTPIVAAEPVGPVAALKRSWALTRGHWWKLFGSVLLIGLVAALVLGGLQFALGSVIVLLLGETAQWSVSDLLNTLLQQLLGAVFSVVIAAITASFYRQLSGPAPALHPGVPDAGHH